MHDKPHFSEYQEPFAFVPVLCVQEMKLCQDKFVTAQNQGWLYQSFCHALIGYPSGIKHFGQEDIM